jgi:hypothetical protein
MRAQDIVDKLSASLPLYTDGFSNSVGILSITVAGTTATVTTDAAHGVVANQNVAILGAEAPVQIDAGTFLRTGSSAVFETLQDHDLTLSERDIAAGGKTITLSGATEVEFNGTFVLAQVTNRRKLIIAVTDAGPTTISGAPIVEDANGAVFNGLFPATNIAATTFDYELPIAYPLDAVIDNASVQVSIRILSVLDIEEYLRDIYTKKGLDDDVLVVQLGDVTQSKKRNEESDAASSTVGEYSFAPLLIQPFAVYTIMNVTDDLTAAQARDKVEAEYIPAIFRSVFRARFDTGFTYSQYRSTFTGHGVFAYSDRTGKNRAIYAHELTFEQLTQLTKVDMVGPDGNVAMRDVDYTLTVDLGTGADTLDAAIDLDEEPIP